jgi:ElaB/YqjD/DUF883 family membrane-anchored ribosome-binding protein
VASDVTDLRAIHDEMVRIRTDTNPDREIKESLNSIEAALSNMASAEGSAEPEEMEEIRAKIARLADDSEGQTAVELDRLREQVREFERGDAGR